VGRKGADEGNDGGEKGWEGKVRERKCEESKKWGGKE